MSKGDLALRNKAIPFEATAFVSTGNILILDFGSDLEQFSAIGFARPHAGDLVQARFSMALQAPNSHGFDLRIAVGRFSDSNLNLETDYSEEFIQRSHRSISGRDTPYSVAAGATLFLDELDLLRDIPARDHPDFNMYGFVVLLILGEPPADPDGFTLHSLRCLCSAQMGLT